MDPPAYAAVVLAGGAARRLGGVRKPALPVAGRSLLDRVLTSVADARPRVVVGPADLPVPSGVLLTSEEPPGGGPVAGAAAGLALVPPEAEAVALLAADLPLLDAGALRTLRAAAAPRRVDVAVFVDQAGHRQFLCGVWRTAALRSALARLTTGTATGAPDPAGAAPGAAPGAPDPAGAAPGAAAGRAPRSGSPAGASMRGLFTAARVADVAWSGEGAPPWFDCDTDADLRRAEEWVR